MSRLGVLLVLASAGCSQVGDPDATLCVGGGFTEEQQGLIVAAVDEWRAESNGKLRPTVLVGGSGDQCDESITGHPNMVGENGPVGGRTNLQGQDWIHLNSSLEPGLFWTSTLHELGHFWTGEEHSPNDGDVMYWLAEHEWAHLTPGDIARLD